MAAVARRKYGQGAVYGSLAYDFNNPELYADEYASYGSTAERAVPRAKPQTGTRVRTRAKTVRHTKQSIAPSAILGMGIAAFLFVVALMANIALMDVSAGSAELESELDQLREEQTRLLIAYESAFNLTEIEEYATSSLGMQKPKADQIYYIDTSSPDKAMVIADSTEAGLFDRVADIISGIGEYFG